jgi:hypothetical protein
MSALDLYGMVMHDAYLLAQPLLLAGTDGLATQPAKVINPPIKT